MRKLNKTIKELFPLNLVKILKTLERSFFSEREEKIMMKNCRVIRLNYSFVVVFMFMLFLFSQPVLAADEGTDTKETSTYSYEINAYNVDVSVDTNNILDVSETINVNFNEARHGIYRYIPLTSKVKRNVNNQLSFRKRLVKVDNISVTDGDGNPIKYKKSRENDNLMLTIGDPNKTVEGTKVYIIKYRYIIGDDGIKENDQIRYNLIPYDWNTTIKNVTFSVHMPKPFENRDIKVTSGYLNSQEGVSKVPYTIDGNTITGEIKDKVLNPNMGLSIRIYMEQGYFQGFGNDSNNLDAIVLMLTFTILSLALFLIFGKNKGVFELGKINPFETFTLPRDINPVEFGYIVDGYVKNSHIVALIIHWANKGYISIENDKQDNFTLIKLKSTDELMKSYEKKMFNKLFEGRETVTALELKYKFNNTISQVRRAAEKSFKEPSRRIYTKNSIIARYISYALAGISMWIVVGKAVVKYSYSVELGIASAVATAFIIIVFSLIIGYCAKISLTKSKSPLIWALASFMLVIGIGTIIILINTDIYYEAFVGAYTTIVCTIAGTYSTKRTEQYNLWLEECMKLKTIIEKIEEKNIEFIVQENSELLYSMLPYAYALGYHNKWMRKFSRVKLLPPEWYRREDNFDFNAVFFANTFSHNMLCYQCNMTSTPNHKSNFNGDSSVGYYDGGGDYNSGGDYSGGGDFGGGGGGDW